MAFLDVDNMATEQEIKELVRELSEATGFTLNDSLDEEVEYDSFGLEVNPNGRSAASSSTNGGGVLSKLIR